MKLTVRSADRSLSATRWALDDRISRATLDGRDGRRQPLGMTRAAMALLDTPTDADLVNAASEVWRVDLVRSASREPE